MRRCHCAEHVRGGSFRVLSFWVNVPVKNRRFKKIKLEGLSTGGLYNTIHVNTIHYITLNYMTVNDVTLHYIQKDKHTLHTLHTLHYITFHSIALHFIRTGGQIYVHTYAMKNIKNENPCQKKNSQSPCEHHENITKSPFFIQGLTHQISPALLMAARPLGMSANFTPSEGEQNPGDPQVTIRR